eukprot:12298640-Alexandrium_andersonii.AAC.1
MAFELECTTRYFARPRDGLFVQPPFRLPPGSPVAASVLRRLASFWPPLLGMSGPCLSGRPFARGNKHPKPGRDGRINYQVAMDGLEEAIASYGLEFAVFDWYVASPIHYWSGTRVFQALRASRLPHPSAQT